MKSKDAPVHSLGFVTVVDDPQHGLFGGYLLLNLAGRPLEFHCTAPVKPNRAQQILYGPTLEPFLYGEHIGATLLEQANCTPLLVCTDREPVLAVREVASVPVALVLAPQGRDGNVQHPERDEHNGQRLLRLDGPHATAGLVRFTVGENCLAVPERLAADRQEIAARLADLSPSFDLWEPFSRIREAIAEAQQGVR